MNYKIVFDSSFIIVWLIVGAIIIGISLDVYVYEPAEKIRMNKAITELNSLTNCDQLKIFDDNVHNMNIDDSNQVRIHASVVTKSKEVCK